ncbi:MAG: sigma-70 family RNA polymerase sigma factor [Acidobacteriota bacterium]
MELTDEQLIAECRQNNQQAWEELVRRYRRLIYAIPRRAGFDEDISADVFQQVFALLIQNIDRIKQPSQIQAWLVTTARRETIRLINNRKNSQKMVDSDDENEEFLAQIPDKNLLADEVLLKLEAQNQVRNAIESIDEKCRKLIEMLFYRQNPPPYSEIAENLGISEGSIGPTRARCLEKVLKKINH